VGYPRRQVAGWPVDLEQRHSRRVFSIDLSSTTRFHSFALNWPGIGLFTGNIQRSYNIGTDNFTPAFVECEMEGRAPY
jgi:hypothetical protein